MNKRGIQDKLNDQIDLRSGEQTRRQLFGDEKIEFKLPTSKDDETGLQIPTYTPTPFLPSHEKNDDEAKGISFFLGSIRSQSISSKEISQNQSLILEQEEVAYAKFNALQSDRLNFNNNGFNIQIQEDAQNKPKRINEDNNLNENFDDDMNENFEINNEEEEEEQGQQFNYTKNQISTQSRKFPSLLAYNNNNDYLIINPFNQNHLNTLNIALSNNSVINDSNSPKLGSNAQILNLMAAKQQLLQSSQQPSGQTDSKKQKGLPKRSETCIAENNTNAPLISGQMTQSAQIHSTQQQHQYFKQTDKKLLNLQSIKKDSILPLRQQSIVSKQEKSLLRQLTFKKKKQDRLNETWRTRGLFILFFVRKFIVYLKNISQDNKFRQLSEDQFDIINDRANHTDFYKYGNFLVSMHPSVIDRIIFQVRQRLNQSVAINSKIWYAINTLIQKADIVINPESAIKLIWDGFMLFLLLINIFYIPLKIGFEESAGLEWPQVLVFFLNDMPGWIFIIDTLLNFNTSFYKKGVIITDRQAIVKHYLKNQFFWDLFVLIPFVISLNLQIKYLDAILLLRFNRILKIFNNYLDLMNLKNNQVAVVDLCKLIVLILFIAHFCGCAFYLLSYFEVSNDFSSNWLDKLNKVTGSHKLLPWYSNYISSFYWAVITMITVGYGDVVPQNDIERIFVIIITLLSCGVFAYSINSIGNIISILTQKNTSFKQKMSLLSIHMRKRGLSTDLQMKVKKYFEYLNDERLEDNQEGENMISQLTNTLKHDIALEIYGKILNSKKLFSLNFSQSFLKELAPKLKEKRHGPEEIIYQQNEICNKIFFITKGSVNLFLNVRKSREEQITIIRSISKSNGLFGELPFFSGMKSDHGAITQNVVSLVYINLEDFLEVLKNHPLDHEKFALIKDNYNLYSSSRGLGCQCQGCGKFTHQINKCPMINYISNKDQIIQKFKKSDQFQIRSPFQRKHWEKYKALQLLPELKEAAIQIIVEQENITEVEDLFQRIEELDRINSVGEDNDEEDSNNTLSHSPLVEGPSPPKVSKKDEGLSPTQLDQQSDPVNHGKSSKLNLNINPNMNNSVNKWNLDKNSDRQSRLLSFISKKTSYEDYIPLTNSNITTLDPSNMNNNSNNNNNSTNITHTHGKKFLRSAIRGTTFIQKMQTKKNQNNGNNIPNQDNDQDIYLNNKKTKNKFIKSLIPLNQNQSTINNSNANFNSPSTKQRKSIVASSLNLQPIKEITMTTFQSNKVDHNNQEIDKLNSFSKLIDLDIPREYKIYYPKNNLSLAIKQNNTHLKIKNKILLDEINLVENPDKVKEYYKSLIIQKKGSTCQKRWSNPGIQNSSSRQQIITDVNYYYLNRYRKSGGNSSSFVQQGQLKSKKSTYLKNDSPIKRSPSIESSISSPLKN